MLHARESVPGMSYDRLMLILNIPTTSRADIACRYLEQRGLKFCVDFGTDNAEEKMADMLESEFSKTYGFLM